MKACALARRELATSTLETLAAIFPLCSPELLHQVAKNLGLDLSAQTPDVALLTQPLAMVVDALVAATTLRLQRLRVLWATVLPL
jgi:hypothetical protein